jgi:Surface antigen
MTKTIKWIVLSAGSLLFCTLLLVTMLLRPTTEQTIVSQQISLPTVAGFNEELFRKIIEERGNAFKDEADTILKEAERAGVSPILFASIMALETGWGTSSAIKDYNNPSGQMSGNQLIRFPTLAEGIAVTGNTLHNLVVERDLKTIEQLGSVYAPVGASNDPFNTNGNWVPMVRSIMKEFGVSENHSLLWGGGDPGELPGGITIPGVIVKEIPAEYKSKLSWDLYNGKDYNTSGSYPFGQCTWYVYNRMAQLGKRVDDFMGNGGDWGSRGASMGYKISRTPKEGTAASMPRGLLGSDPTYGHVAFVEYVNPDGSILISECNVLNPGSGTVSYRVVDSNSAKQITYVEGK